MIRSLFTYIKNKLPSNSTNRELHRSFDRKEVVKVDRFDKVFARTTDKIKKRHFSIERKNTHILETLSNRSKYSTPRRSVINQCVRDVMLNPRANSIKFQRYLALNL